MSVSITIRSHLLGDVSVDLDRVSFNIASNERNAIENVLAQAVEQISRAYGIGAAS